jgi:LuxR family transcriptional regulator
LVVIDSPASGLPAVDQALPSLRLLGPSGFIIAFNISFRGPEHFHSEYPRAWQAEYDRRNYGYFDPVLLWTIMNTGEKRWSDIRVPDLRGVMRAAARHALTYGAAFSRSRSEHKSILTIARPDREFADEELSFLGATFDRVIEGMDRDRGAELSEAETNTLRCLRDGLTYQEAAMALEVSVPAVKARVERIRGKLGARNVVQAVALAVQRRLI